MPTPEAGLKQPSGLADLKRGRDELAAILEIHSARCGLVVARPLDRDALNLVRELEAPVCASWGWSSAPRPTQGVSWTTVVEMVAETRTHLGPSIF